MIWPSEKEINISKREYAKDLGKYTRVQINAALIEYRDRSSDGQKEYFEPDVLRVLQVLHDQNSQKRCHKVFPKSQRIESDEMKSRRKRMALESCSRIMGMLDE